MTVTNEEFLHDVKMRVLLNLKRATEKARMPILAQFQDDSDMMAILALVEQLEAAVMREYGRSTLPPSE
jgi:hypothetical protein